MSKDSIFSCYYDENLKKDEFYRGTFFRKKVSEEDFYGSQREFFKESRQYRLLPVFENTVLDTITFLYSKSILSRRNNWESDFGERVTVKAEFLEDENFKKASKNELYMPDYFYLKVWLFRERTGKPLFKDNFTIKIPYSYNNYEYWNYSADYLALLIRNSINGNLQTARDIEETVKKRNLDIYLEDGWELFKCDECGEKFTSLNEFFCHLLEHKHYDSFLDEFPNDREVLHVKKMLEDSLKN